MFDGTQLWTDHVANSEKVISVNALQNDFPIEHRQLVTCCSRGRRQLSHGVPVGLGGYQGTRLNREIQGIALRIFTGKI